MTVQWLWVEHTNHGSIMSKTGFVSAPEHPDQLWDLSSLLFNGHSGIFITGHVTEG